MPLIKLTNKAIEEYKEVHFAEFGEKITDAEAEEYAQKTLTLLNHLFMNPQKDQ
jgi:hypothetical protein